MHKDLLAVASLHYAGLLHEDEDTVVGGLKSVKNAIWNKWAEQDDKTKAVTAAGTGVGGYLAGKATLRKGKEVKERVQSAFR